MSASATVQVGASHATVSSNGLLRFGYTNITDRAHLFSDSLQFKEDGTIHVWRDRAAFPLVEISWQGDAAELPSDNHLVWTVLYSDDGSRVDRCRKCPATHMLGFRLSHPPNKVVAWGTPVENDCVTPITSNNHNNIALGMAGPDIFPSMRFGNIPTTGCLASSHKMFLLCNSHFHDQRLFKVRVSIVDGATNTVVASVDSAPMKVVSKFLKGRKKSRSKICSTPAVVLPGALARSGSFSSSGFVSDDATAPMPARSRLARRVRPPARFSDSFRGPLGDLVEDDAEDDYDDDGERVSVKANDDNDSAHTRSDFSATVSDEDLVSSASGRKRTASVANHSHNAPHVGATDFYDDYGVAANVRSASATADVTDLGEERPAKRQKSGGGGSGGFTLPQLDTHDHSSDMDDRPRFRPSSAGPTKSASPSEFKSPVAAVGDDRRASYDDLVVFDLAAAELAQRASSESVPDAKHPGMPAPSTPLSLRSTSPAPAPTGSRVSPRFLTNADKKSEILALFSELDFASKVSVFDRLVEVPAARAWPAMQQCIFNHGLQYEIMQAEAPLQKAYQNVLEILRNTPKGNRPPLPMCESVLATLFDGTEAELSATAL